MKETNADMDHINVQTKSKKKKKKKITGQNQVIDKHEF